MVDRRFLTKLIGWLINIIGLTSFMFWIELFDAWKRYELMVFPPQIAPYSLIGLICLFASSFVAIAVGLWFAYSE